MRPLGGLVRLLFSVALLWSLLVGRGPAPSITSPCLMAESRAGRDLDLAGPSSFCLGRLMMPRGRSTGESLDSICLSWEAVGRGLLRACLEAVLENSLFAGPDVVFGSPELLSAASLSCMCSKEGCSFLCREDLFLAVCGAVGLDEELLLDICLESTGGCAGVEAAATE